MHVLDVVIAATVVIVKGDQCRFLGNYPGADPGFFLGGGALVSCSTSTPINHIVFAEYQLY